MAVRSRMMVLTIKQMNTQSLKGTAKAVGADDKGLLPIVEPEEQAIERWEKEGGV